MPAPGSAAHVSAAALAIDGGTPVRPSMLPYGHQMIEDSDVQAVFEALRSGWLTTGPAVTALETAAARFLGAPHAVAVSNGTAALHAAVIAAGIGPGDEVIVPALTFVATANCVRYAGGDVRFADVRPDTLTIDPVSVERAIGPRTRAIIAVDYAGTPCDLDDLRLLATRHGLVLIEDAAHAIGARYRSRPVGSIADLTTFSFHPVKQMTTGEGGLITTQDERLADTARMFRNHGISADARQREGSASWVYDIGMLGWNYRLSDILCALGSSQLARLPRWLERRGAIAARYDRVLADLDAIERPVVPPDRTSAWHLYVIRLRLGQLTVDRGQIFRALRAENIGVNVHYIPVPWLSYYQQLGHRRGQWPVTEISYERMITLPLWPGMTDEDVDDVVEALRKVSRAYRRRA